MIYITPKLVKEIAEILSSGLVVYIHKVTGQLISVPDMDEWDIETDEWEKDFNALDNNPEAYYSIKKWTSHKAFQMMEAFAYQLPDLVLQEKLFTALDRKHPFRNFENEINDSGQYRQQWFDFEAQCQQDYVKKQLEWINAAENPE